MKKFKLLNILLVVAFLFSLPVAYAHEITLNNEYIKIEKIMILPIFTKKMCFCSICTNIIHVGTFVKEKNEHISYINTVFRKYNRKEKHHEKNLFIFSQLPIHILTPARAHFTLAASKFFTSSLDQRSR